MAFTIGTVPYLNALPLIYALPAHRENLIGEKPIPLAPQLSLPPREYSQGESSRLISAVPSHLAPMLARGECDVALIPVVEHFRGVGAEIISDACVGSSGPVRSVLLFHKVAPERIRRVALDESSRTSSAMLRVILRDAYGIEPQFVEAAPNLEAMFNNREYSQVDAALLIGDPALESALHAAQFGCEILDLACAWKTLTGLPFVFAAWVTRKNLPPQDIATLARVLANARDEGVKNVEIIARDAAPVGRVPQDEIEDYLRHAIEYVMTDAHRAGLEEFRRRVFANGLA